MDLFDEKRLSPMLIAERQEPFDDPSWLYELKFDGERCIAYLEPGKTDIRNKRYKAMLPQFPELECLHKHVNAHCILDGELMVMSGGKPDFEKVRARSTTTNPMKIRLRAEQYPATFLVYDILYRDGEDLTRKPLTVRKDILRETVILESDRFAVSKVYDEGCALFELTGRMGLEGVVAKRRDSIYRPGKRTRDWVKFKHFEDEDFVVCGYIRKQDATSLILGLYDRGELTYQGHLTLGVTMRKIAGFPTTDACPFTEVPDGNENAVWFDPLRVCAAKYMHRMESGGMRQPSLIAFRDDKLPEECRANDHDQHLL